MLQISHLWVLMKFWMIKMGFFDIKTLEKAGNEVVKIFKATIHGNLSRSMVLRLI
jgi:hypothetical protein